MSDKARVNHLATWRDRLDSLRDRFASLFLSSDFLIRYRPGQAVVVHGRISKAKIPAIVSFFSRDLTPRQIVTVRGKWTGRALRLTFSRGLTPAARQQVRNFLIEHLR